MRQSMIFSLIGWLFFWGCAGLQPSVPEPTVSISSFKVMPSNAFAPRFEIGMRIVNTSRSALKIDGLVYTVALGGNRVLTGVANDISSIAPYSEGNVTVAGAADLFGGLGFLNQMFKQQTESIKYKVDVSIDAGSLYPMIHSTKEGTFSLQETLKVKH